MDTPREKARNSVLLITTLLLVGISLTMPWYKFSELWLTSDIAGVHVNKDTTIYFLHGSRTVVAYDNYQTMDYEGYDATEPSGMGYYMRNEGLLLVAWVIFCWLACMLYVYDWTRAAMYVGLWALFWALASHANFIVGISESDTGAQGFMGRIVYSDGDTMTWGPLSGWAFALAGSVVHGTAVTLMVIKYLTEKYRKERVPVAVAEERPEED